MVIINSHMLNFAINAEKTSPKKQAVLRILSKYIPYFIILVASFLPFICFFQYGENISSGDDVYWHKMWVYDLSEGWKNGFFGISPSHELMGNLGVGTYLMYAPLSHSIVALIHIIFPFISIVTSWKIVIIGTTFLMGCWMYMLGKRICKNGICGLMLALILIFAPYRINCILYRAAFPESVAISFYPLLFLGVYEIGHKDYRPQAFLCCIFGVSCLVLSHPYTALIGVIAALVYLFSQYKGFIGLFKDKVAFIYTCATILIIFSLVSFYVFPMMHYTNSGLYCVSDNQLMWTNIEHIVDSMKQNDLFSGVLRPDWIDDLVPNKYHFTNTYNESSLSWGLDYLYFGIFGALAVFLQSFFSSKKKPYLGTILAIVSSFFPLIFTRRPEMLVILPLFAFSLLVIGFSKKENCELEMLKRDALDEAKSPEIYAIIVLIIFSFLLLFSGWFWEKLPEIFLNAQFAWRAWGLAFILIIIFIGYLVRPFRQKLYVQGGLAMVFAISFLSCMGIVDKRFCLQSGQKGSSEPTAQTVRTSRGQGSQNEYTPLVFRDSKYVSQYSNSLYKEIRKEIYTGSGISYQWGMEDYLTPVFLEGDGEVKITSLNSPNATFDITVNSSSSYVQFPQFFFDGYELQLEGENNYTLKGENVDGLLSFHIPEGTYKASLKWVGLTSYRVGVPLFFVGLASSVALYAVPKTISYIKKRKDLKNLENANC